MIVIKKREFFTVIFFLIAFIWYSTCMAIWGMTNNIRYLGIILGILQSSVTFTLYFIKYRKLKNQNLLLIFALAAFLWVASKIISYKNGVHMSDRVYVQISYLIIPAIYTFFLSNILEKNTWNKMMKFVLVYTIFLYLINTGIGNFFSLNNLMSVSLGHSIFENSAFSGIFTISTFFFQYNTNFFKKNEKKYLLLSVVFSVLAWKRLSVLFVLLIWIFGQKINLNKKINKIIPMLIALFFAPMTIVYTGFVEGNYNLFGLNPYLFTTGRNYTLSLWKQFSYVSAGYGSSYELIHRYLEMDLVQLYLEVGIIAVILLAFYYFNLVGKNLYGSIIMVYEFLNLLTASSFPDVFGWILILAFIVSLNSYSFQDEGKREK